jgi:hypothetical protein
MAQQFTQPLARSSLKLSGTLGDEKDDSGLRAGRLQKKSEMLEPGCPHLGQKNQETIRHE